MFLLDFRVSKPYRSESIKEDVTLERNGDLLDDDNIECDDDVYTDNQGPTFIHHTINKTYHHGNHPLHSSPIASQYGEIKRSAADYNGGIDRR